MIKVNCAICGNSFEAKKATAKYCGTACSREADNARCREQRAARRRTKPAPPKVSIAEVIALAQKEGLSYGEYVGQHAV